MSQFSVNQGARDLSNTPEAVTLSDNFGENIIDEVSRTAYLRLYSKHAAVVKNNLSRVSDDVDGLFSSIMSGFASFEMGDTGGDLGGNSGGGGFSGTSPGFGAGG